MAWFKVDDGFFSSKPVLRIQRRYRLPSVGLWLMAGTWSAQEELDGFVPEYVLEELCGTPSLAGQLVSSGLWENVESHNSERGLAGWQFRNWGKYQPTKAELDEAREKERIRKAKYRASQRDTDGTPPGLPEGHQQESEHPDPTRPDPTPNSSPEGEEEPLDRPDVAALCDLLAGLVEENGSKRPAVTKAWRDSARLLLDRDGRELEAAARLIRWVQADSFWQGNVLSMPTFRKQYDRLRLAANHQMEERRRADQPRTTAAQRNLTVVERFAALEDQQHPSALEGM